jgi:antitoxin VapB
MKTAKLFQHRQSQAVRLPKDFRFEGKEVLIKKSRNAVVLIPLVNSWGSLIDSLGKFTKDYMVDRPQPGLSWVRPAGRRRSKIRRNFARTFSVRWQKSV